MSWRKFLCGGGCCLFVSLSGCGLLDQLPIFGNDALVYDFRDGANGWTALFADFAPNQQFQVNPVAALRSLPDELVLDGTGLLLGGSNVSDDLAMTLVRELTSDDGIEPNTDYVVQYYIVVASNAPTDCAGIGGAPGEGVYLKAGATGAIPTVVTDADGDFRFNFDFGNQSTNGAAASVVSDIANGVPCEAFNNLNNAPYVFLVREHQHNVQVRSSADGRLWLLVGTDSGFEGRTELFFQRIEAFLTPVGGGS